MTLRHNIKSRPLKNPKERTTRPLRYEHSRTAQQLDRPQLTCSGRATLHASISSPGQCPRPWEVHQIIHQLTMAAKWRWKLLVWKHEVGLDLHDKFGKLPVDYSEGTVGGGWRLSSVIGSADSHAKTHSTCTCPPQNLLRESAHPLLFRVVLERDGQLTWCVSKYRRENSRP